jgi:5-oxopent-3-ene-1,2,5-tricarboxylate decarboxylase/2-hydroxyhepta-2,4-diene-1,7-dioate isomerase
MRLISYRRKDDTESVGLVRDPAGPPIDLLRAIEIYSIAKNRCAPFVTGMIDLLDMGLVDVEFLSEVLEFVAKHNLVEDLVELDYTLLAPIARPRAIYALGRNYPAHARESGVEVPKEPVVFGKAPTAVIGPDEPVIYRKWLSRVDPEAELAVVIGKGGYGIAEEEAPNHIAGYTVLNDVTARDIQSQDLAQAHPWLRSKGIDTFCPMGPAIVLSDEVALPLELDVEMRVNGEIRQHDNTRNLTFSVPYLISWISRFHTLYPGDVISTGTPEGMAPVKVGDVMEASVERVGVLRNPVVAEE